MSSKKTRGKQKITIKRIEKDEDRLVTLSKRRNGIYSKLTELAILCGADVGFLMFSGTGKPYTFGSPSFKAVAGRFLNGGASSSSASSLVVDAHRKAKIEEMCKLYNSLTEKARAEQVKAMTAATSSAETLPVVEDAWWRKDPTQVKDVEEAKQLMKRFEDLYEKLCEEAAARNNHAGGAGNDN